MMPEQLALEIVAEHARRAEKGINVLTIGDTRCRGMRPGPVRLVGFALDLALPLRFSVGPNANDVAHGAGAVGTGQEDAVAPDDRRRMARASRQLQLPKQVLGIAPFERDLGIGGVTLARGAAPL